MASKRKSAARKSAARKSTRKATGAKGAKAEKGARARHPKSVALVDGDRAADPTVGKNVAAVPKSTKEAGAAGTKGRSVPSGTTVESQRRGSGNPPGPITTDADRKALADREKYEAGKSATA